VPSPPPSDKLSEIRQISLALRLTLNPSGRLLYGEVVDVEAQFHHHFESWEGLTRTLQEWLADRSRDKPSAHS
jgi:hypothetical protein